MSRCGAQRNAAGEISPSRSCGTVLLRHDAFSISARSLLRGPSSGIDPWSFCCDPQWIARPPADARWPEGLRASGRDVFGWPAGALLLGGKDGREGEPFHVGPKLDHAVVS